MVYYGLGLAVLILIFIMVLELSMFIGNKIIKKKEKLI